MQKTKLRSLGWEDTSENEVATHSSILAWEISQTEEPGRLQFLGSQRVGHNLATKQQQLEYQASLVAQWQKICLPKKVMKVQPMGQKNPLEKEMANDSSIHAWEIPWTEQPGRLQSMGSQNSWTQFSNLFSCPVVSNSLQPMNCSTPGLPVPHHLSKLAQAHIHCISDAIQSSHPLTPPSPSTLNLSQNQGLFQ